MDTDIIPEDMTEKERIDFIREYGSEQQKAGLRAVLNGNKYKAIRKEMWNIRLQKGIRMVQTILDKHNGSHIIPDNSPSQKKEKTQKGSSIADYIK
ncbi:hypothetical protein AKJ51_01400 [candidate division MSBL1 archaeon SCGC-AAA382A20]|uniref:Uncharacterized protein n=1 Tax=candidate division MSBL1 archaeon SCGC-AAA382A20 TaxID=1698280 RepID=A0A133VLP1_9EURY|nr:hypothetical protein AKJ51_01400 [candidate division MSBL1 archaeon SCGC-AAA382A20]